MANELEILTENAAGTSWVDLIPSAVSTGYQAQNTNIEANRNGIDSSYVRYDSGTDEIVIDPSGPIDVNGVPFSVKSEIRLANPGAGTWYLKVVAGSDDTLKSIETKSSMGSWVAAKNALYDTGERVLNWVFDGNNNKVSKLLPLDMYSGGDNTFTGANTFTGHSFFTGPINPTNMGNRTRTTGSTISTYVVVETGLLVITIGQSVSGTGKVQIQFAPGLWQTVAQSDSGGTFGTVTLISDGVNVRIDPDTGQTSYFIIKLS